jgi:hypothetical protein
MGGVLPIVAAIPNFNMGEQLEGLLPKLAQQDYADIFGAELQIARKHGFKNWLLLGGKLIPALHENTSKWKS